MWPPTRGALRRDAIRRFLDAVATGPIRVRATQPTSGSFQDGEKPCAYASVANLGDVPTVNALHHSKKNLHHGLDGVLAIESAERRRTDSRAWREMDLI